MNKVLQLIPLTLIIILFTSCSYNQNIKEDLVIQKMTKSIIQGNILKTTESTKNTYVILYKYVKGNKKDFKSYKLVDFSMNFNTNRKFKFDVVKGTYFIYACQNLEKLREEKYGYIYENYIDINQGYTKNVDIKLNPIPVKVSDDNILISSLKEKSILSNFGKIKITGINNAIFKRENGHKGLWDHKSFYKEIGGGLYLLDKFDKNKKAILFVHGINGTPLDFKNIIDQLDKNKYLPIVYFYPSGINLNYTVDGLKYSMDRLKRKYELKSLIVIAHSMGGLVSRAFINNYKGIEIEKFISISTPWNGNNYAKLGGEDINHFVPSFGNMIPGSAFIKKNIDREYPFDIKHYLLFSYKGTKSFILEPSNDGVISLKSQLYDHVEQKAYKIYGFNETHRSILENNKTIMYINNLINE